MLYVGIDPGEKWCGFAALDITSDGEIRVEARTYNVAIHKGWCQMAGDLIGLLPHNRPIRLVCEDFHIRGSGHQRFSRGDTLRFLGALEYAASRISFFDFALESPSDRAIKTVPLLFGKSWARYRMKWPKRNHPAWNHCASAWRVLGNNLLRTDSAVLANIHEMRQSVPRSQWLPSGVLDRVEEYMAPSHTWK